MEIAVLPKDLEIGEFKDLQLYDYRRTEGIRKTKIRLSENMSPQLSWSNVPKGTASFAITMYDPYRKWLVALGGF